MFCLDSIISVHDIDLAVTNFPLISQVGGWVVPSNMFVQITAKEAGLHVQILYSFLAAEFTCSKHKITNTPLILII
jgi:hypothetical protein